MDTVTNRTAVGWAKSPPATRSPILHDLCCGSGGWTDAFLKHGWICHGYDIDDQPRYKGIFHKIDARQLHGLDLLPGSLIVASPPCDEFSRHDQPWTRRRNPPQPDLSLWHHVRTLSGQSGLPYICENVRGAQPFVGSARWHYESFYLWGDVPALMPSAFPRRQKQSMSSSWKLDRARVPMEIGEHLARVFWPPELAADPLDGEGETE